MKKLSIFLIAVGIFGTASFVSAQEDVPQAGTYACATDVSSASLYFSILDKQKSRTESADLRAGELLLFLDLDGAFVTRGNPNSSGTSSPIISRSAICPPPNLTAEKKARIVELVRDDFSPFNIRVTTDQFEFDNYPSSNKQICILTTRPGVVGFDNQTAGVSPFAGLHFRMSSNPSFVFADALGNRVEDVAAVISHESGHGLGLGHQHGYDSACNIRGEYHLGFGSGPLAFLPTMGSGIGVGVSNWFAQPCLEPIFGEAQNDYDLINEQVSVRADDYPDVPGHSLIKEQGIVSGVLERGGDIDYLRLNFRRGGPVTVTSDNIDLKVTLLNAAGVVLAEFNDPDTTSVSIPNAVGVNYLKVEAAGNENMAAQFMTGTYRVNF